MLLFAVPVIIDIITEADTVSSILDTVGWE